VLAAGCAGGGSGAQQTPSDGASMSGLPTDDLAASSLRSEPSGGGAASGATDAPRDPSQVLPSASPELQLSASSPADTGGDGRWAPGPSPAPQPATEVAAASFGGQVWVAGGLNADGEVLSTVQVLDPVLGSWQRGPELPQAVHHAALVSAGSRLLLIGGYSGPGFDQPSAAVFSLEASGGQWQRGPRLPAPRAAGAAAWDGQRVVYGGGVGPSGLSGDVLALSDGSWQQLGALSVPREHLAAASDGGGRVWLLAGRRAGLETNVAAVELVRGERVERLGQLPTPRGGVSGFYAPGAGGCVVGGEAPGKTFAAVECLNADGSVTTLPDLATPRHGLGAVAVEGFAYALLGGDSPGLAVTDISEVLALQGVGG
jgi:non-specific serine/threonine protein kinase